MGKFDSNKNVVRLIKAVCALKKEYPDLQLNLVGGKGGQEKDVQKLVQKYSSWIHYHGEVYDKDVLREIYSNNAIFAMPSIFETFGLVYIEGLFKEKVGEFVNPLSVKDIKYGLAKLLGFPQMYDGNQNVDFELFRWRIIAEAYKEMYLYLLGELKEYN